MVTSGAIIVSMVAWVYRDSSKKQEQINEVFLKLTESMSKIREDMARQYVSLEMHGKVTDAVDKAIHDLQQENRRAIDSLAERIDQALLKLASSLQR
jgi:gas vesicle protein